MTAAPMASYQQMGRKKGQPLYRVTNKEGQPLMNKDGQPVDGGGYKKEWIARTRAETINDYYKERA